MPTRVTTWGPVLQVTMLVNVSGITDEYHQSFIPNRDAIERDVPAGGLGGFLAAVWLFWREHQTVTDSRILSVVKEGER